MVNNYVHDGNRFNIIPNKFCGIAFIPKEEIGEDAVDDIRGDLDNVALNSGFLRIYPINGDTIAVEVKSLEYIDQVLEYCLPYCSSPHHMFVVVGSSQDNDIVCEISKNKDAYLKTEGYCSGNSVSHLNPHIELRTTTEGNDYIAEYVVASGFDNRMRTSHLSKHDLEIALKVTTDSMPLADDIRKFKELVTAFVVMGSLVDSLYVELFRIPEWFLYPKEFFDKIECSSEVVVEFMNLARYLHGFRENLS